MAKIDKAEREMQMSRGLAQLGARDCYSDEDKAFAFMKVFHPHLTDRQIRELLKNEEKEEGS